MNEIINQEKIVKGDLIKFPYTKPGIISKNEMYEVINVVGNRVWIMGDDGNKVSYPLRKVKKVTM